MYNFVSGNNELIWALSPETTLHIQKFGGLENMKNPSRALEVTLGSGIDTNLGHNHNKKIKKMYIGKFWVAFIWKSLATDSF